MTVFKEIKKADKSGVTQFFRLSAENATVETNTAPDFYTFKGNVSTRAELPTSNLSTGDAYYIEDEDKVVFWTSGEWANVETYVINYNYENASNKPSINGHVLKGQMTAEDLDLQPAGDYLTEVPSEYITEDELAAEDYASKTYVMDQINNTEHFHREIVDALPLTGKDNVLYLVPKTGSDKDIYNEYIWTGTDYELMGTTAVDLSDYYVKEETNKLLDKKVDKISGKGLSTNDYTTAEKTKLASLENYDDTQIKADLAALHNYDDTDIKNDITALKTAEKALKTDVKDIKEDLKDKIEGVRLVRSGDMWDFYTVGGTRLTYESARELLGHPNTILYMEGVENDGKTTPADYDIDEELIHVHYMDEMGEDRYLQMGYPNTASAEGSYIHIADAVAQPLNSLTIDGKIEQRTTTGKNLYNYKDTTNVGDGVTADKDGWITITADNTSGTSVIYRNYYTNNLNLKTNTNYAIVMEVKNVSTTGGSNIYMASVYSNTEGQFASAISYTLSSLSNNTIKIDTDSTKGSFTNVSNGLRTFLSVGPGVKSTITFRLSVLEDTAVTAESFVYEPYTGEQPSPNPDYPQNIEVINDNVNIEIKGKNLFNTPYNEKNKLTRTATKDDDYVDTNYYVYLKAGEKYTFSCEASGDLGSSKMPIQAFLLYDKKYDYFFELFKKNGYTFSPLKTGKYYLRYDVNFKGETHSLWNLQIEKGENATTYEPYQSRTFNIDLQDNELCSLSSVKDKLIIKNGKAKIIKNIGKVVLNGSEAWEISGASVGSGLKAYRLPRFVNIYNSKNESEAMLDHFVYGDWGSSTIQNSYIISDNLYIRINQNLAPDLATLKSWLSINNVTIYHELITPYEVNLGEIDIPATFEGVNNITIDSDLSPNIKIDYITNVNYLDKNIGFKNHYIGYYEDAANLPTGNKGDIATVTSDKRIYINDGNEWIPSDKNSIIDLSNYLAKDNTTGYAPTGNYNPATKKYVDDSIKSINIPTKTSQLTNDSNFVIKTTNELTNYYTKNNTYTKNEVNALVAGGSGGDSKIETLDITGGKDITALLNEGSHIYYLACDNEDDSLRIHIRTITGKKDTVNLLKGAMVSLYYAKEDNALLLSYFGGSDFSSPNYGTFSIEGSEITKSSILDETRYTDINYITKESGGSAATLTANYINMFLDKKTVPVYLNGSESKTNLEFPKNTIIIGRNADFVTRQATGLIIFPTGALYKITSANIVDLHIEELSFATEDYVKSREMPNLEPGNGTGLFGWYSSTPSGGNLTENGYVTPDMVEDIKVGQVYEWPSTLYIDCRNRAVVTGTTKIYDNWSTTRASGGESSYKTFIVYLGNGNTYTYAFDDTTVYKETYPSDK